MEEVVLRLTGLKARCTFIRSWFGGKTMVTLELEPDIEERVRHFALENRVSESFLIREAILKWLEDREDYAAGIKALSGMKYTISQEEMKTRADVVGRVLGHCGRRDPPTRQANA